MKRDTLFLIPVFAVLCVLALGASRPTTPTCISSSDLSSISSALDFSDETAEYVGEQPDETLQQLRANVTAIHTMNATIRTYLGLPPWS